MSPIRLSLQYSTYLQSISALWGAGSPGSITLPPRGPRWCVPLRRYSPPAAPLPKSRSWGVGRSLGATGRAIGDAPKTRAALVQRGHNATYHAGMLQCTLFPTLPRDVLTRPAFDLETPRNLCAEGTVRNA